MSLPDGELEIFLRSPSRLRELSDEDLMKWLCAGVNDALTVLFERHSAHVFRIARAILRDDGEAEETVQRVFMDLYRAKEQFNSSRGLFTTWLRQCAYHRTLHRREHLQSNRAYRCKDLDEFMAQEMGNGTGHLLSMLPAEIARLAEEALALLDPQQRKVIELTYFQGLTAKEIAKTIGDSVSTVHNNLYRGLIKVRKALNQAARIAADSVSEKRPRMREVLVESPRPL